MGVQPVSYRRKLVKILDRPGGRFLLGKIATAVVRRGGAGKVQIAYIDGLWTRRVQHHLFPDGKKFEYEYSDFSAWEHQMDLYIADAKEYWLRHYQPRDGDTIVDVGAGRGEDTAAFSRSVGKTGRVIAIEAHPHSFAILKKFCEWNGLINVTALNLALMAENSEVCISDSEVSWQVSSVIRDNFSGGYVVRGATLAEVCEEYRLGEIAFLKMNIEGGECEALRGMDAVMPQINHICVACHDFWFASGHGDRFRTKTFVEQFLIKHGFRIESRPNDPRDYVRDHVFGIRTE